MLVGNLIFFNNMLSDLYTACNVGDLGKVKDILRVPPPAGWELANILTSSGETALLL